MKYYYYKVTNLLVKPYSESNITWINKAREPIKDDIMPMYIQIYEASDTVGPYRCLNSIHWEEPYEWKNKGYIVEELTEEDLFPYFL